MNQMTRPGNAARLSEDIGDVLSAIRRLIAEDEALDYARDTLEKQQIAELDKTAQPVVAHPFANPHDGHAAMARRMVAEGSAALSARMTSVAPRPHLAEMVPASFRSGLVADEPTPATHAATGRLIASRDLPVRRDHARLGVPPLRLRESDRVITGTAEETDLPAAWGDHDQQIEDLRSSAMTGFTVAGKISASVIMVDDDDDFAEAFDAKARMRPAVETSVAATASIAPAALPVPAEARTDDRPGGANPLDAFWQAYANTPELPDAEGALTPHAENDDRKGLIIDDSIMAIEAGIFSETCAAQEPATADADDLDDDLAAPVFSTLSIPSYPADEVPDLTAEDQFAAPAIEAEMIEAEMTEAEVVAAEIVEGEEIQSAPTVIATVSTEMPESLPTEAAPVAAAPAMAADLVDPAEDAADDEETTIRELIREMVQEELHGELGQRFSRNLRAVIRREVAAAIDDHLERL